MRWAKLPAPITFTLEPEAVEITPTPGAVEKERSALAYCNTIPNGESASASRRPYASAARSTSIRSVIRPPISIRPCATRSRNAAMLRCSVQRT